MPHLFMVSLGPVQDFIAAARRSRDLWFGSFMLSELSKAAAREIVRAERDDVACLIFPSPPGGLADLRPDARFNVANKILARIEGEPLDLGPRVKAAVQARLQELRGPGLGKLRSGLRATPDARVPHLKHAQDQLDDLPEVYWAALPLTEGADYGRARRELEGVMQARKLTRDFSCSEWGAAVPKSSLDGQRESVIPETEFDEVRAGRLSEQELFNRFGVAFGERLCGVGLLKRHGRRDGADSAAPEPETIEHYDHLIYSTSHYAALPVIERIRAQHEVDVTVPTQISDFVGTLKGQGILDEHLQHLAIKGDTPKDGRLLWGYDGRILFTSRYPELLGIRQGGGHRLNVADRDRLEHARAALAELLGSAAGLSGEPSPYYALLHADGDHMGLVIEGYSQIKDHQKISRTLAGFTEKARAAVEDCEGRLLYSGGDDVLAFLPVHLALRCVDQLSTEFAQLMKGFKGHDGQRPTLSSGLVIAHFMEPLSDVLAMAREAERVAKEVPGKDALAITLCKRGGGNRTLRGRRSEVIRQLYSLIKLHRDEEIPDGLAYELEALSLRLASSAGADAAVVAGLRRICDMEALRIFKRKRGAGGAKEVGEDQLGALRAMLRGDLGVAGGAGLQPLIDSLIIAGEIARVRDIAGLPKESPLPAASEAVVESTQEAP